jgi:hypothetical protein
VESIGRVGTPGALALLEDIAWKNTQDRARMTAVESMGRRYPAEQALDKLSKIADSHPDADTRRHGGGVDRARGLAARARGARQARRRGPRRRLEAPGGRRAWGAWTIPASTPSCLRIVKSQAPDEVRRQAVESLGRRDGAQVSNQLEEIARTHESMDVRRQAGGVARPA